MEEFIVKSEKINFLIVNKEARKYMEDKWYIFSISNDFSKRELKAELKKIWPNIAIANVYAKFKKINGNKNGYWQAYVHLAYGKITFKNQNKFNDKSCLKSEEVKLLSFIAKNHVDMINKFDFIGDIEHKIKSQSNQVIFQYKISEMLFLILEKYQNGKYEFFKIIKNSNDTVSVNKEKILKWIADGSVK